LTIIAKVKGQRFGTMHRSEH